MNTDTYERLTKMLDIELAGAKWKPIDRFPIETPMVAGFYLKDAFSSSGYSGGYILEFSKGGQFSCHAQDTWSILADIKDATGVIVIPLQETEKKNNDLDDIMIGVMLDFVGFSLSEKGIRVATFKVVSVTEDASNTLSGCTDILETRKRAFETLKELA